MKRKKTFVSRVSRFSRRFEDIKQFGGRKMKRPCGFQRDSLQAARNFDKIFSRLWLLHPCSEPEVATAFWRLRYRREAGPLPRRFAILPLPRHLTRCELTHLRPHFPAPPRLRFENIRRPGKQRLILCSAFGLYRAEAAISACRESKWCKARVRRNKSWARSSSTESERIIASTKRSRSLSSCAATSLSKTVSRSWGEQMIKELGVQSRQCRRDFTRGSRSYLPFAGLEELRRLKRRAILLALSGRQLPSYSESIRQMTGQTFASWRTGEVFDIYAALNDLMFRIMATCLFGRQPDANVMASAHVLRQSSGTVSQRLRTSLPTF